MGGSERRSENSRTKLSPPILPAYISIISTIRLAMDSVDVMPSDNPTVAIA